MAACSPVHANATTSSLDKGCLHGRVLFFCFLYSSSNSVYPGEMSGLASPCRSRYVETFTISLKQVCSKSLKEPLVCELHGQKRHSFTCKGSHIYHSQSFFTNSEKGTEKRQHMWGHPILFYKLWKRNRETTAHVRSPNPFLSPCGKGTQRLLAVDFQSSEPPFQ